MVDESVHIGFLIGKCSVVHGNQPARTDVFSQLRSFVYFETLIAANGQQRNRNVIRAQPVRNALIGPAVSRVIDGEAAEPNQIAQIWITAERSPIQLRMR